MQVSFLSLSLVMSSSYVELQECHHCDYFVFIHLPFFFFCYIHRAHPVPDSLPGTCDEKWIRHSSYPGGAHNLVEVQTDTPIM